MKKAILFFIILLWQSIALAQFLTDTIPAGWGTLDYSIPESPVFNLLSEKPDNILTPVSAKPFNVEIADFRGFGAEVSPLAIAPNLSLGEFNKNWLSQFWYRSRLSVGTNISNKDVLQLSGGLRFTIFDKTDLRSDKMFQNILDSVLNIVHNVKEKAIDRVIEEINCDTCKKISPAVIKKRYYDKQDTLLVKKIEEKETELLKQEVFGIRWMNSANGDEMQKLLYETLKNYYEKKDFPQVIKDLREKRKQDLWNAQILEIAIAGMKEFPNKYFSDSALAKVGIWTTFGFPLGKKGQGLLGGKYEMADTITGKLHSFSLGTRYYYGTTEWRLFGQLQCEYNRYSKFIPAISTGVELKITDGLWTRLSANCMRDNNKYYFIPAVNLFFGSKEKKK